MKSQALRVILFFLLCELNLQHTAARGSNPCQDYSLHDCDALAECDSQHPGLFQCKCPAGYVDISPDKQKKPGRKCKKLVNECTSPSLNECDKNSECVDTSETYACRCKPGWVDISVDRVNFPGRNCKRSDQCINSDCAPEAECREGQSGPICQCQSNFVDVSSKHGRPAGRVCKLVVNECLVGKHDCSPQAICIDTADSFTCRCRDGFRDEGTSPDRPGRNCVLTHVPAAPECNVNDPMSCDKQKHEVCMFRAGTYMCACPTGYSRLPDGRCLVINECEDSRLNDCSADAECVDQAEGYTCQCKSGFADVSPHGKTGMLCRRRVNECARPSDFNIDCDANSVCVDIDDGFTCRCRPGFADISESFNKLPGRRCIEAVNECLDAKMNDCSENAICEDAKEGYTCKCRPSFVDASANNNRYPGRICNKPTTTKFSNESHLFSTDLCDPNVPNSCKADKVCMDSFQKGTFVCDCPEGSFLFEDGTCRQSAACKSSDCDKNAFCINIFDSYRCQCRPGFFDISSDPEVEPGRTCKELINECANGAHDCSPFAECIDSSDGYACVCTEGFVDTSTQLGMRPGRKCSNASNECADRSLNTCDENADCIDTAQGYHCQCFEGYIDVSSSAHLPHGRVCTVQTTCPKQRTDLVFLVDGSGSIGSLVFKNEVLRFIRDFLELFDVGLENTRVSMIQYSDQIRHEFDLNQYTDKQSLLQAIANTQYLTGLTRTGAAIQHMVVEGFAERRGARPLSSDVSRVAIVITDGRSQDNVTEPAKAARDLKVNMFAIGVTDHVLASELEAIAGSPHRWFYVDRFKDLNMRLRSIIQKMACPSLDDSPRLNHSHCNSDAQTGCDRSRNEVCVQFDGHSKCQCPKDFPMHPQTHICGGQLCNPDVLTSCPYPEVCKMNAVFGTHRCVCPADYSRDMRTGICLSTKEAPPANPTCKAGLILNPRSGKCIMPGSCDPSEMMTACDVRKRERCLLHPSGKYHTCQCVSGEKRHPVTEICLKNECLRKEDNDCDGSARCIDTDDGFICACQVGFLDQSPDPINKPGRLCIAEKNECLEGQHHCSPDAICTDTPEGYVCRCKPGYVDFSSNPQHEAGRVCKKLVDECNSPQLNTCHKDAICVDTSDSYNCICKVGFTDLDELRNPGRNCEKIEQRDRCQTKETDCDKNARCVSRGPDDYGCLCLPNFKDKSPDPVNKPGRVCIPMIPECDNPSLNDCDSPDRALCIDTDEGYLCQCRQGFFDISPQPRAKPGRLCKALENECEKGTHDCAREGGICDDTPDSYICRCAVNYLDVSFDKVNHPGRNCKRLIDECLSGQNDCSPSAICTDTEDSYICSCPANFLDVSPDSKNRPGRRCLPRVNECLDKRLYDCSPNANCEDTPEGFTCHCAEDFVDESQDSKRPGRVCRPKLVDECRMGKHDCHSDAECIDLPQGYTCQCGSVFIDESPNRALSPGRMCVPRPTPPPEECRLAGNGCKAELNEICRVIGGVPKCSCPINYSRDNKTKACSIINECLYPQFNDCHVGAECIDKDNGYTCKCRKGYKDIGSRDNPGRNCLALVSECQFPHLNDCHQNAQCIDLDEGYQCRCNNGFKDLRPEQPGRLCKQLINECARQELNSCDRNAKCLDQEDGYNCECKQNYLDVSPSPTLPGRLCRALVNECAEQKLNDCDKQARCIDTPDSFVCECPPNSKDISPNSVAFPGRVCHVFENECLTGKHDCDPSAVCRDNEQSYTCECPSGFKDRSPNKSARPGRVCVQLIDECQEGRHTCSPQAECRDLEDGYTCECRDGYVDRSPNMAAQPGRVCGAPETCPSNHDCSSAAICEPLGGNQFQCTCIQGYEDQSPAGMSGRICTRVRNCADSSLNNCSRNAICYDEPAAGGYRCECRRGFVDKSLNPRLKGRICEPPPPPSQPQRHPCQGENECNQFAACRATGAQSYICECLSGYVDQSPNKKDKPGRVCVQNEPVCLDANLNDCHSAAICMEMNSTDGYTCKCRDGYTDQSPDKVKKPGRVCIEMVNECMDRSLNDCDRNAVCEDLPEGYSCRCPINALDQSADKRRPGRKCFIPINECANSMLNNCSRFADCIDKANGFECKCRSGYHDTNPHQAGTSCQLIINECLSENMNDCSRNAECIDLPGNYTCKCRNPYIDAGPKDHPGRVCKYNECKDSKLNDCSEYAICEDTDDSFVCRCKEGFFDDSGSKGKQAGRVCVAFGSDDESMPHTIHKPDNVKIDGVSCGLNNFCMNKFNEVCVGGTRCMCRPGQGRAKSGDVCRSIDRTPLTVRVVNRGKEPLYYGSEFGSNASPTFVEFANEFQKDVGKAISVTTYATRYVTTDVSYITHPKTVNSSWPDGLLVNFTVGTVPNPASPIDRCDLWKQLMESLHQTNGVIGGGRLQVASDVELLNPCLKYSSGEPCAGAVCDMELGEVCIANAVCGCPKGQKRARTKDYCRPVEAWTIPLWVIRKNQHNLVFNESFGNPLDDVNKAYVRAFESGVGDCYPHTMLKSAFVTSEVNDIMNPASFNSSWNTGILYNATMYFRKGAVQVPADVYNALVRYIIDQNNYQVGHSGLYLNPFQANPFGSCYKNDCNPKGVCVEVGPKDYRCECSQGFRDLSPENPGRECIPTKNFNECDDKKYNVCSNNSRCIDLEFLYKCECLPGFTDASTQGAVAGSVCNLDYCNDVTYCSGNSSCINLENEAACQCKHGFSDIRGSPEALRTSFGLRADQYCLSLRDIDECALGLHNCSKIAECTDLEVGYTCQCPSGYIDGNPEVPGRVCAALLCDLCNKHGDCVHDVITKNITCQCTDGYTGEFCEVAPSMAPLVLLLLLALLFLLLACCCLLWLCTKLRCFRRWGTPDHSSLSESGGTSVYGGIPRAKLKASSTSEHMSENAGQLAHYLTDGFRIPRAHLHDESSLASGSSEYTIREEIERRITTDVTRTEVTTTEAEASETHQETVETKAAGGGRTEYSSAHANKSEATTGAASIRREGHEEQERGESIAEFSNSGEWQTQKSSAAEYSSAFRANAAQQGENEVYDKTVQMKRQHQYDPATQTERYLREMTTAKSSHETYKK